ncbi:hypothetical protein [Devosia nitrariae]|uniref:Uncharacterized protein n=1 Tax=Devosia nitrariae TaxID=2071872 RepID=A0ABQ5W460_9HYPH|nr:hypothetical protein [Devosia nitrariae]GLQ54584.1 hypothetical protein GCM10010862_18430 [Devosia nitrariae]
MSKSAAKAVRAGTKTGGGSSKVVLGRDAHTGRFRAREERVESVMEAAERSGLLTEKSSRIAGRVSPALVEEAKRRTGIKADTDLIAFALANVALEDNFAEAFKDARAKIDRDVKLGF